MDISFRQPELLVRALTHRSAVSEGASSQGPVDNEQLEYLGDAVLGMIVSEYLVEHVHRLERGAALQEPGAAGERRFALRGGQALGIWAITCGWAAAKRKPAAGKSRLCSPTRLKP